MAIYVRLTAGSSPPQPAGSWSGSNLGMIFDGLTNVTIAAFDDPATAVPGNLIAAANVTWELLNAPAGTAYNEAWFIAANAPAGLVGTNPLNSAAGPSPNFRPDIEGTWFFRCTNTLTSDTIDFVVATNNVRTNTRIPAAGETTEADQDTTNHAYPLGSPSGQGWAKDRDYALDVFDDLTTSGGVQLCYWDGLGAAGAPWATAPAGLKSGAALALTGALRVINHTTGEEVPVVGLADGNTNFEYVGLFKADTTGSDGSASSVNSARLIWVSRSGVVECGGSGVIDTSAATVGEIFYLSTVPGLSIAGNDRFLLGVSKPLYEVPTCMVLNTNATGKVMTLPAQYLGGIPNISKTFRFNGIGDFSGLRVGSTDVGAPAGIDGELLGCVEMIAVNNEAVTINAGTVCMLTYDVGVVPTVQAYIADSNSIASVSAAKREGIVGVAIQNVLVAGAGHFCIYGAVTTTLSAQATLAVNPGAPLYIGSSRVSVTSQAGVGVLFDEVAGNFAANDPTVYDLTVPNRVIPIGQLSSIGGSNVVMVGFHQDAGFVDALHGGLQNQTLPSGVVDPALFGGLRAVGTSYNKSVLQVQDSTVTQSAQSNSAGTPDLGPLSPESTVIKVAGSGADDPIAQVDMYECKIPGTILYQSFPVAAGAGGLDGSLELGAGVQRWPGSVLEPSPLFPVPANALYGTFNYDLRCGVGLVREIDEAAGTHGMFNNATRLKVYGVTEGTTVTTISIQAKLRFNTLSVIDDNGGVPLPVAAGRMETYHY